MTVKLDLKNVKLLNMITDQSTYSCWGPDDFYWVPAPMAPPWRWGRNTY